MNEHPSPEAIPPTTLYVLVPPSPLFAAHWSFFIPNLLASDPISRRHEESNIGRRIHVSGDRLNGFTLEIIRGYDISKHRSVGSRRYLIATIPTKHLSSAVASNPTTPAEHRNNAQKDEDEGGGYIDNDPMDDFEWVCAEIEAPGPSLNRVAQGASETLAKRTKAEVKDCQWWIKQAVGALFNRGTLEMVSAPDDRRQIPREAVNALPVH